MARCISNFNPLNANLTKCSDTLKQFVGKLPTNYLIVFDHFVGLALKGLILSLICRCHFQASHVSCLGKEWA